MKYGYIMGRGHSGSTVLDAILGHTPFVESVGEILSGMARLDAPCSCDRIMRECAYWTKIRNRFETRSAYTWEQAASEMRAQAHVRGFFATMIKGKEQMKGLIDITTDLAESVLETSTKSVMLDSSKTPARALFLVRHFPQSRIIHLVRHPADVLASNYWRIRSGMGFTFLRRTYHHAWLAPLFLAVSAISWLMGNLLAEVVRLIKPSQVMLIRYEDLGTDPEVQFARLSDFLDVDVMLAATAIAAKSAIPFGHNIGGNHVRRQQAFIFDGKKRSDHPLPTWYALMAKVVCWPLMLRYGYRIFGSETR